MAQQKVVRLFFTVDDNYITYLSVTIASIVRHASKKYKYHLTILHDGLSSKSKKAIRKFQNNKNIFIWFYDVTLKVHSLSVKLDVRDYYTITTYYRLFLPDLFPLFNKGLYLDSDIVVRDDIAKLYFTDLGDNLVGAVPDASVQLYDEFINYVHKVIEMDHTKYFNAGVLLMNFKKLREFGLEKRVVNLLKRVTFKVAQDQDLLNYLCKDKTLLLDKKWNVMPLGERVSEPFLIHYNLMFKPWNLENIMYEEEFFKYAELAGVKNQILKNREAIPQEVTEKILQGVDGVKAFCNLEASKAEEYHQKINGEPVKEKYETMDQKIKRVDEIMPKLSPERREVVNKIIELERLGKFDVDVENDPPYRHLMPGDVDYLRKKWTSKVKTMWANYYSYRFFKHMIKKGAIVIDGFEGIENLKRIKGGAVITANHFSPFDSIPLHLALRKYARCKKLYKVIREGNYTMPGIFGYFLRNCNTLPLATNPTVLRLFQNAVDTILHKGNYILIYPEQSMWWNYRKPKPLKQGAFIFAARNNVPVIPTFITMRDTDKLAKDGSIIQAYTLHFLPAIYPEERLSQQENVSNMKKENERLCKEVYEKVYGEPLTYLTEAK
ncbi:MAG: 1-acyl-sn-glycerol-3-phosphate acyltransferase [Bacilli bacterium]|nr:1-acyl-sn-glycerol-3-phosphate acyltransferase [Bacilli bacterium]